MTLLICLTNHHIGCAFHFSFVSTTINILLYLATGDGNICVTFYSSFISSTKEAAVYCATGVLDVNITGSVLFCVSVAISSKPVNFGCRCKVS